MPVGHLIGLLIRTHPTRRGGSGTHDCNVGHILDECNGLPGLELAVTVLFKAAKGKEHRLWCWASWLRAPEHGNIYGAKLQVPGPGNGAAVEQGGHPWPQGTHSPRAEGPVLFPAGVGGAQGGPDPGQENMLRNGAEEELEWLEGVFL